MNLGKRILAMAGLALLVVVPSAAAAGEEGGASWLWVQQAERGSFTRDDDGWKLTLEGVPDDLVAFTDRPDRMARVEPLSGFLAEWQLRFDDSAPNAAIVLPGPGRRGDVLVVTLSAPVVRTRDGQELVYRAEVVPLKAARRLNPTDTPGRELDTDLPRSFEDPVLFVDSEEEERVDRTIYTAVMNHEEQYSIWPVDRELPLGWVAVGNPGPKAEVLAYIEEVWTDMRPKSLRERMGERARRSIR